MVKVTKKRRARVQDMQLVIRMTRSGRRKIDVEPIPETPSQTRKSSRSRKSSRIASSSTRSMTVAPSPAQMADRPEQPLLETWIPPAVVEDSRRKPGSVSTDCLICVGGGVQMGCLVPE